MHICPQCNAFINYTTLPKYTVKRLGDVPIVALGQGTIIIHTYVDNQIIQFWLSKILHVPKAHENLISLGQIDHARGHVVYANGQMHLYDSNNNEIALSNLHKSLYYINICNSSQSISNVAIKIKNAWTWEEWYCHLGHIRIVGL